MIPEPVVPEMQVFHATMVDGIPGDGNGGLVVNVKGGLPVFAQRIHRTRLRLPPLWTGLDKWRWQGT